MGLEILCKKCGSPNIGELEFTNQYLFCHNCESVINMDGTPLPIQRESDQSKQAEFQNPQTAEVGGKPSTTPMPLMVGFVPADKLGLALTSVQKNAGLRSLLEIADEIDQLLLLTDEQDFGLTCIAEIKASIDKKAVGSSSGGNRHAAKSCASGDGGRLLALELGIACSSIVIP